MTRRGSEPEEIREPSEEAVIWRLRELGIPTDLPGRALRVGYTKGDFTTTAHPVTYQGTVVWAEITGELRSGLALEKWEFDDTDNIPRAVSPDGGVIVIPVRGNDRTGIRSKHELLNTYRPRGTAGVRMIKINTQIELALHDVWGSGRPADLVPNLGGTWFLLYNRTGDVVRSELSFANKVDKSGMLLKWSERLILPDIDMLNPPPGDGGGRDDITPPEIDVPVSRRAG